MRQSLHTFILKCHAGMQDSRLIATLQFIRCYARATDRKARLQAYGRVCGVARGTLQCRSLQNINGTARNVVELPARNWAKVAKTVCVSVRRTCHCHSSVLSDALGLGALVDVAAGAVRFSGELRPQIRKSFDPAEFTAVALDQASPRGRAARPARCRHLRRAWFSRHACHQALERIPAREPA